MKNNITFLGNALLCALLTLCSDVSAQNDSTTQVVYPKVPIECTELRQIHSANTGTDYFIKIWLPQGYNDSVKSYPVLYLLDGDHAFAMATDIVQYLYYGGFVPKLIIVSPAYGSKLLPTEGGKNMRNRDLIPFQQGSEKYLRFLREELIPYVETHFKADSTDRTFEGFSYGAQFGTYALFQNPTLFKRWILIDGLDDRFFDIETKYALGHTDLPVKLFFGEGAPSRISEFTKVIEKRKYAGLEMEFVNLAGVTHFAIPGEGLTRGLKFVYGKRSIFEVMLTTIRQKDFLSALAQYQRLKQNEPDKYNFGENELNDLGYALLSMKKIKEAIQILELNAKNYPVSSNVFDGLGEAYMDDGNNDLAIVNYKKSLELDSTNTNAVEMLKKLSQMKH